MIHDEVCMISGIRPNGCPTGLVAVGQMAEVSSQMASEMSGSATGYLDTLALASIIRKALRAAVKSRNIGRIPEWIPWDSYTWSGFDTAIAIGYFDAGGGCPTFQLGERYLVPRGPGVAVRRVKNPDSGNFGALVSDDPKVEGGEIEESAYTVCSSAYHSWCPNFFILEGPYMYLKAWLDKDIPPRSCRPAMPLAEELYEIVNSRIERRELFAPSLFYISVYYIIKTYARHVENENGLFPGIEYGPIAKTLKRFQNFFLGARIDGSPHTSKAIAAGLRKEELIPALTEDFQFWLFIRPDM